MADTTTSWILELVDKITAPMKNIAKATGGTEKLIDRVTAAMDGMSKDGRKATQKLIDDHKDLQDFIKHTEERIEKNTKALKDWDHTNPSRKELEVDVEDAKNDLKEYRRWLNDIEDELDDIANSPATDKMERNWGDVALAANQAWEVTQKIFDSMKGLADMEDLRVNIQRMTGFTEDAVDLITEKVHRLQEVYKEDSMEIALAANATAKQMHISFDEALNLIERGFVKGANLNGDMLDQLKEYGPQMRAAGLDAAETLAIMAHAGKDGIFSDKALDSIKEANLSLRELGQPQVDALKAIGLEVDDLAGKTVFQAVQMIVKHMKGAPVQARQMVIADIFKGAGEDAGISFIEGLDSVNLDLNNIPSVQQAGESTQTFLANMQSWFGEAFGNIAVFGQQFGGIAIFISSMIPILSSLSKATWVQNIASKALAFSTSLLNKAFISSPFGWIVAGLAAITAGVMYAWDHFEGFREVVMGLWESFKQVFSNILGLFKAVFAPIGEVISAVREGRWADAGKAILKMNPVSVAGRTIEYVSNGGLTKGVKDAYQKGAAEGRESFRNDQAKKEAGDTSNIDALLGAPGAAPTLDGSIISDTKGGSSKGKKKGDGSTLSLGGGMTGGNTIHMELEVNNYFGSINSDTDIKNVAGKIVREVNDQLRDALVQTG